MKKNELIRALEECAKTEESAIPIYTKHVGNTLFLSELDPEERSGILKTLDILARESLSHEKIFRGLLNKVKRADKDVF